jgi:WD40 repeat protein
VLQSLKGPSEKGRFQRVAWTDLNRTLISAGEDGCVRRWDVEVRLYAWRRIEPAARSKRPLSLAQKFWAREFAYGRRHVQNFGPCKQCWEHAS